MVHRDAHAMSLLGHDRDFFRINSCLGSVFDAQRLSDS
ncbi:hypothetical protein APV28_2675 [Comamonas testosteroni]|nr:hypothetical protein APV28_2675 [Comamonas testosteroni]